MSSNIAYQNKSGTLFRVTGGSSCSVTFVNTLESGYGKSVFDISDGSYVSIVGVGRMESSSASVIKAANSKVVLSNVDNVNATDAPSVQLTDSSLLVSNVKNFRGNTPITMSGTCHVHLNRIGVFVPTGSEHVSVLASSSTKSTLVISNTPSITGKIHTLNASVTLNNVQSITTTSSSAIIFESSAAAKGSYRLKINGPTTLSGPTSLSVQNCAVDFFGVVLAAAASVYTSTLNCLDCTFTGALTLQGSTLTGTRSTFAAITPTESSVVFHNCTAAAVNPNNSSVVGYHSYFTGAMGATAKSAITMHNGKLGAAATITDSFLGLYGGTHSSTTTAGKGAAIAYGIAAGSIDGYSTPMTISTAGAMSLHSHAFTHDVTGAYTLGVTTTYDLNITGAITIDSSAAIGITATGADVTITGTSVII